MMNYDPKQWNLEPEPVAVNPIQELLQLQYRFRAFQTTGRHLYVIVDGDRAWNGDFSIFESQFIAEPSCGDIEAMIENMLPLVRTHYRENHPDNLQQ